MPAPQAAYQRLSLLKTHLLNSPQALSRRAAQSCVMEIAEWTAGSQALHRALANVVDAVDSFAYRRTMSVIAPEERDAALSAIEAARRELDVSDPSDVARILRIT